MFWSYQEIDNSKNSNSKCVYIILHYIDNASLGLCRNQSSIPRLQFVTQK